jgi:hypothetical protein
MTKKTIDDNEIVEIRAPHADRGDLASRLLEAAGDNPQLVRTTSDGFKAPAGIVRAAGMEVQDVDTPAAAAPPAAAANPGGGTEPNAAATGEPKTDTARTDTARSRGKAK